MRLRKLTSLCRSVSLAGAFAVPLSAVAAAPITASLDTGVDNDQLVNVRVPGYDFVDNDTDTNDRSPESHGTFQALIFNDAAPTLPYMPLRTYFGTVDTRNMVLSRGQAAIDFALQNPNVKVIMMNRLQPIDVGRLKTAANRDVVVIINAGNESKPYPQGSATLIPQLGGRGLIVTGVTSSGTIAPESNRPGAAYAEHTISALHSTSRTSIAGTSFAMPRVAAAAARVKARDPQLTPYQVVEVLKRTAIDIGEPGIDPVYGHGLLNPNAAFEAVGTPIVPEGGGGGGGGGGGSSSAGVAVAGALVVGAGLYALFKRNDKLKRTLVLDEFGRSFWLDMSVATPKRDRTPNLYLAMAGLEREHVVVPLSQTEDRATYAVIETNKSDLRNIMKRDFNVATDFALLDERSTEDVSYSFHSVDRSGNRFDFGLNKTQENSFGALSMVPRDVDSVDFLSSEVLTAPFLGFTDQGVSSVFQYRAGDNVKLKLGLSSLDDQQQWGLASDSAFFETSYETPRYGIGLQIGELHEDGSLFGGSSSGAFSVDSAETFSLGISGRFNVTEDTALVGSYTVGFTDVKHKEPSLLSNFSTLRTDSYGAGLISRDLFKRGDAFGVGYFQPLRVDSGKVDVSVPYARDVEGNIYSDEGRYSLVPDGVERDYELYYAMDVGRKTRLASHFLYRQNALHDADADRERVLMFTLDREF